MPAFYRARFVMDSIPGQSFTGFTDGSDWNGWACPYFTFEEAVRVLRASQPNGFWWRYDSVDDAFTAGARPQASGDEPEYYEAETVEVDGETVTLYPVGARYWIWEEAQD